MAQSEPNPPTHPKHPAHPPPNTHEPQPTKLLTGLKAYASLIVYNEHLTFNFTTTFNYGYGSHDLKTWAQLPFLRLFLSGLSMVFVFCTVSGFMLSYRTLELVGRGEVAAAHERVASMAFRRGFRLFGPALVAVLTCAVCVWAGVFEPARRVGESERVRFLEALPERVDGLWGQVGDAVRKFADLLDLWNWDMNRSAGDYDTHTWTLPVEYRCSMVLFSVLFVVCRFTRGGRLLTFLSLIIFAACSGLPELSCFLSGSVLAEMEIFRHHKRKNSTQSSHAQSTIALVLFLTGAYLSSIPFAYSETDPMYAPILALLPRTDYTPPADFIRGIGAVLIMYGALRCTYLRPIFSNAVTEHLGKVSFGIYLIHGNVLKAVLRPLVPMTFDLTSDGTYRGQTQLGVVAACLIGAGVTLPLTVWLADLFRRVVEVPMARYVGDLERVLIGREVQRGNGKAERLKVS